MSSITFLRGFFIGILSTLFGPILGPFQSYLGAFQSYPGGISALSLGHFSLILGPFQPYLGAISALSRGPFQSYPGAISVLSWGSCILSWSFPTPRPFLEVLDEPLEVAIRTPKILPKHALNAPKALRKPVSGRQIFQPYPGRGKSEIRGCG